MFVAWTIVTKSFFLELVNSLQLDFGGVLIVLIALHDLGVKQSQILV